MFFLSYIFFSLYLKIHPNRQFLAQSYQKTEAVVWRLSLKKMFLKISQISQENACAGGSFEQTCGLACNFIKKRLQHWCFPVKFAKLLRIPFFTEHLRRLLLDKSAGTNFWPDFTPCFRVFIFHLQKQGLYSSVRAIETYIERFGIYRSWVNSGWFSENIMHYVFTCLQIKTR